MAGYGWPGRPRFCHQLKSCVAAPSTAMKRGAAPKAAMTHRGPGVCWLARRHTGWTLLRQIQRPRGTVLPQRRRPVGDDLPNRLRQRLAVLETRRIDRGVQQYRRTQSDMLRQAPEMRGDVHVAVPCKHRPAGTPRRQPAQPVIDDRYRLDQRQVCPGLAGLQFGDREERTSGTARRATRRNWFPPGTGSGYRLPSARAHRIAFLARGSSRAGDEHCPPQARDRADDRPGRDIAFGDETPVEHPADHRDIDP